MYNSSFCEILPKNSTVINSCNVQLLSYRISFKQGHILVEFMDHKLVTKILILTNKVLTCTYNPKKGIKNLSKLWTYPVMIMKNNSIPSSHFVTLVCKCALRKPPTIPRHVDILMLHIFYVLKVIITGRKVGIFLVFVVLCMSSMN